MKYHGEILVLCIVRTGPSYSRFNTIHYVTSSSV